MVKDMENKSEKSLVATIVTKVTVVAWMVLSTLVAFREYDSIYTPQSHVGFVHFLWICVKNFALVGLGFVAVYLLVAVAVALLRKDKTSDTP